LTSTCCTSSKVSLSGCSSVQVLMASSRDISRLRIDTIYLERLLSSPLTGRGARVEGADRLDGVGLLGALVLAVAADAGEAQGEAARVAGAGLEAVEGDLDPQLGADPDHPAVAGAVGQLQEALGLPAEQLVGQALEGLAEHHEPAVGVAGAQVEVGQPALAAAVAPLDGQDDQVEGVDRLDLEPAGPAAGGPPGRGQPRDHSAPARPAPGGG